MSEDPFQKFYRSWLEATKGFTAPWIPPASEGSEKQKDSNPGFPFAGDWTSQANTLFERMMWFPPFSMIQGTAGPAFQNYSKYHEIVQASVELYQKWTNLYLEFSRAMADVAAKLNARLLMLPTADPKQVYTIWIEEYGEGVDKMLRDDEVAKRMASFLSSALDVKKQADAFMEGCYKTMSIPTRSEMDRVYKEIYELKKSLRSLRKSKSIGEKK